MKFVKKIFVMPIVIMAMICSLTLIPGSIHTVSARSKSLVVEKAKSRLGCPYVFGACHSLSQVKNRSQRRFDCSGLINWSYYQAGYRIGVHTTRTLKNKGRYVGFNNLKPGDVILFYKAGTHRICHCGLYIGGRKMIHAPCSGSRVKIVKLNNYWHNRFASGRRL